VTESVFVRSNGVFMVSLILYVLYFLACHSVSGSPSHPNDKDCQYAVYIEPIFGICTTPDEGCVGGEVEEPLWECGQMKYGRFDNGSCFTSLGRSCTDHGPTNAFVHSYSSQCLEDVTFPVCFCDVWEWGESFDGTQQGVMWCEGDFGG